MRRVAPSSMWCRQRAHCLTLPRPAAPRRYFTKVHTYGTGEFMPAPRPKRKTIMQMEEEVRAAEKAKKPQKTKHWYSMYQNLDLENGERNIASGVFTIKPTRDKLPAPPVGAPNYSGRPDDRPAAVAPAAISNSILNGYGSPTRPVSMVSMKQAAAAATAAANAAMQSPKEAELRAKSQAEAIARERAMQEAAAKAAMEARAAEEARVAAEARARAVYAARTAAEARAVAVANAAREAALAKQNMEAEAAARAAAAAPARASTPPLEDLEEVSCEVCSSIEDDENMLLCDGCDSGYHLYCLRPKLKTIPDDDWFCAKCVARSAMHVEMSTEIAGEAAANPFSTALAALDVENLLGVCSPRTLNQHTTAWIVRVKSWIVRVKSWRRS